MKRPLNETEEKATKLGVENRIKEIKDKKESIKIHLKQKVFMAAKREYEEILLPYNNKIEDLNLKVRLEKLEEDLNLAEKDLINLKDQLKSGVEVKRMSGVQWVLNYWIGVGDEFEW